MVDRYLPRFIDVIILTYPCSPGDGSGGRCMYGPRGAVHAGDCGSMGEKAAWLVAVAGAGYGACVGEPGGTVSFASGTASLVLAGCAALFFAVTSRMMRMRTASGRGPAGVHRPGESFAASGCAGDMRGQGGSARSETLLERTGDDRAFDPELLRLVDRIAAWIAAGNTAAGAHADAEIVSAREVELYGASFINTCILAVQYHSAAARRTPPFSTAARAMLEASWPEHLSREFIGLFRRRAELAMAREQHLETRPRQGLHRPANPAAEQSAGSRIPPVVPRLAARFFHQAHVADGHSPVDGLAHVVDGEQTDRHGGEGLHLHPRPAARLDRHLQGHRAGRFIH